MVENLKWTGWTSNLTFNLHQINLTLYCMCLCMVEYDIVIAIYFTCNWYVEHINAHVVKLFSNLSCCIDRINVAWFLVQIAWTWPACYIWSICYIMNALLLIYQRKTLSLRTKKSRSKAQYHACMVGYKGSMRWVWFHNDGLHTCLHKKLFKMFHHVRICHPC